MTAKDPAANVGKTATIELGGLRVPVRILDTKSAYGRDMFAITPVAGDEREFIWVNADRVRIQE